MSHLHLESCLQLLLLTARVVFKGPTMYGTCKARVACLAGNVFFFGRPVFWFNHVEFVVFFIIGILLCFLWGSCQSQGSIEYVGFFFDLCLTVAPGGRGPAVAKALR